MSTAPADRPVKHPLLETLHREVVPALEALVAALPPGVADAAWAERRLRTAA